MTKLNLNSQQVIESLTQEIKNLERLISINEGYWSSGEGAIPINKKIKYEAPKKKIEETDEYKEIAKNYDRLTKKYGGKKLVSLIYSEIPHPLEEVKPYSQTQSEIKDKTCKLKKMIKVWEALHADGGPINELNKKISNSIEVGEVEPKNYELIYTILIDFRNSGCGPYHKKTLESAIIACKHCLEPRHHKDYEKVLKIDIDNLFNYYKDYKESDYCSSYTQLKAINTLLYGLSKKQKNNYEYFFDNDYQHSSPGEGRGREYHFFEANLSKFQNLKQHYQDARGDFLKTKILELLKDKIVRTTSKEDLNKLKLDIMNSDEYGVLKKGQGLITRLLHLDTSSKKALDKMFVDQEEKLDGECNKALLHK